MVMKRILGIDPGSQHLGYGVIDLPPKGKPTYVASGVINLKRKDLTTRLVVIFHEMATLIEKHKPDEVAVEDVFSGGLNRKSSLVLAHARGVVLLSVGLASLPCFNCTTQEAKQCVTGNGSADKLEVQRMLKALYSIETESLDATDALAVALWRATVRR